MDEQVQTELIELLKTGGRNLCTMPRVLGMLLRQRCPDGEAQIQELEQALTSGAVAKLLAAVGPVDESALANQVADECRMPPDRAERAVASWVRAIDASDATPTVAKNWSDWNKLDVSNVTAGGVGTYQRAVVHLIIVGLGGAIGGGCMGLFVVLSGGHLAGDEWRHAVETLATWLQVTAVVLLGVMGGFTGGILGWIAGGGRSWTYDAVGGTTLGRLAWSTINATLFAVLGVPIGLSYLGLIGAMLGSLIGAFLGAIVGLMAAEGKSRMWR